MNIQTPREFGRNVTNTIVGKKSFPISTTTPILLQQQEEEEGQVVNSLKICGGVSLQPSDELYVQESYDKRNSYHDGNHKRESRKRKRTEEDNMVFGGMCNVLNNEEEEKEKEETLQDPSQFRLLYHTNIMNNTCNGCSSSTDGSNSVERCFDEDIMSIQYPASNCEELLRSVESANANVMRDLECVNLYGCTMLPASPDIPLMFALPHML
ncbi:uncharacterized protein TM35_000241520 [Trypanosoma theileri]|uniref:Uncharacterized protein n=1 Tax=Trypanosoma theileri TaxID=67003 RepID=A0A1X0NQM1_9TRYP|nr:uncharacterized protein TM35_000241520 [Trypanosoma theileri]ORC87002.1 hypothetical protein TM35_000241520 [Trypanosoma theileri]